MKPKSTVYTVESSHSFVYLTSSLHVTWYETDSAKRKKVTETETKKKGNERTRHIGQRSPDTRHLTISRIT